MSKPIYILGSGEISEQWANVFVMPGAQDFTINFVNMATPSREWLHSTARYLTTQQSIELYNHALIWTDAKSSFIVLNNSAAPSQPGMILLDLFREAFEQGTIVFFGRYNENKKETTSSVIFESLGQKFTLRSAYEPQGAFAYFSTNQLAKKLLNLIPNKLMPVDIFLGYWVRRGIPAVSVTPNVVNLPGEHVQYLPSQPSPLLIILIAILAAVLVIGFVRRND